MTIQEELEQVKNDLLVLRNEITKERKFYTPDNDSQVCATCVDQLTIDKYNNQVYQEVNEYFQNTLKNKYKLVVENNRKYVDKFKSKLIEKIGKDEFIEAFDTYHNEGLEQFVTNKIDLDKIVEKDGYLIQKSDPIYLDPIGKGFFKAQFYAPNKNFFGILIPTFIANVLMLC